MYYKTREDIKVLQQPRKDRHDQLQRLELENKKCRDQKEKTWLSSSFFFPPL